MKILRSCETISFELVCKPSFTCLERNEAGCVQSHKHISHKRRYRIFWYQFVILKSSRFYYAPLTCFLKFNPKLAICQERLILRFDRTILFYSPSLIFLNVLKKFIKHINMSLVTHISILFDICMSHSYASVHLSCIIWPTFAICIVPMSRPPLYR